MPKPLDKVFRLWYTIVNGSTGGILTKGDAQMDARLVELKDEHRINRYLEGVFQVVNELNRELPWGYRATTGESTWRYAEAEIPAPTSRNVAESILVGFVTVHHGDPHYPIFIYRESVPMHWSAGKVAHILGISAKRVRVLASHRHVGLKAESGDWWFTADDVEALRERRTGRPAKAS